MGVSFVSIENARLNLDKEQSGKDFDKVLAESRKRWHDDLSRIVHCEGGTDEQKIFSYGALSCADTSQPFAGRQRAISGNGKQPDSYGKGRPVYRILPLGYLP